MMTPVRILLCDDDSDDRDLQTRAIKKRWSAMFSEELDIQDCRNIVEDSAVDVASVHVSDVAPFDVVLLDIWWGKVESGEPRGKEIATLIREKYPEKPIVVFSGKVSVEDFVDLIPIGVSAFLHKGEEDARIWCAEIKRAIEQNRRQRPGMPLFRLLRQMLEDSKDAWSGELVGESATQVLKNENSYQKWRQFWSCWSQLLGGMSLKIPCQSLSDFFVRSELLMLSVQKSFRGHLEHVLYVYFTGYIASHRIAGFREYAIAATKRLMGDAFDSSKADDYWSYFQIAWLIVGTLHDVAYPLELLPDVVGHAKKIGIEFEFARFTQSIEAIEANNIEWGDRTANAAKLAYRSVLSQLYGIDATEFIEKNVTYERAGQRCFNHGVASGMKFLQAVEAWSNAPGFLPKEFVQWIATAMSLHSLKHADGSLKVSLKKDPLSFLLAISDELQIWDRNRPDEITADSAIRRVELVDLVCSETELVSVVDYSLYPLLDGDRIHAATDLLIASINKDQKTLRNFIVPEPFKIRLQSRIKGSAIGLPEILID